MKVALIFSYDPAQTGPTEAEFPEWLELDQKVKDAGILVSDAGLYDVSEGKTVQVRDNRVSEGVPEETGNVVAGFYVLELPSIEEAVKWAQEIPTAKYGQVEVRRVVEM